VGEETVRQTKKGTGQGLRRESSRGICLDKPVRPNGGEGVKRASKLTAPIEVQGERPRGGCGDGAAAH